MSFKKNPLEKKSSFFFFSCLESPEKKDCIFDITVTMTLAYLNLI
jgi:hypothetical protein